MAGMDFKRASSRVRSLIAAKKPGALQKSSLTSDPLRDNVIAEEAAHSERFKGATRQVPRIDYEVDREDGTKEQRSFDWTSWPEMLRDVARASFEYDEPEVVGPDKVRASHRLNREIMAEMLTSEGFQQARPYSRGNPMESIFNGLAQAASLRDSAKTRLAEHIARSNQMEEQEDVIRSAEGHLERLRELAKAQIDANGQVDDQTRRDIKRQVKDRQAGRDALANLMQQMAQSSLVADAASAAGEAAYAGAQAMEAVHSLPGITGGNAHNMTPDQQIALAEKWTNNEQLRRIAAMLGRMYRDMRFKREARTKNVPIEPVGITTGREIQRMLPHELGRAYSSNELVRMTWLKDYAGWACLEYEMSGKLPAGKGPIIAVTDGSGSMSGDRFVWASSLCLCLLMLAHRENRDFAGIEFGYGASELKSWFFPKGVQPDADLVIDYASHFFGGGTDITVGLTEALAIVENVPAFKTADVILMSDGQDHYQADDIEVIHRLNELGVRVHGISIACRNNRYMEQACEYVEDVMDLAGANDTTTRIAQNIT